ncbi:hypothetical protein N3C_0022 [Clostridium sp. N3C]|mgnify:CR=1 FL=1|uniref:hypothetical protein n=1 Tax=Clostridium sp. N3C TaxID=1776758 RepID=UPI00092E0A79|nr:hypothetical protein [Clostridium sp. N3C]NLZ34283.1 hypothetical protein [Clostridiales bacterium]SCN21246.1 hypothetical protein N3C_0022 [Clostridium sp. N3C]
MNAIISKKLVPILLIIFILFKTIHLPIDNNSQSTTKNKMSNIISLKEKNTSIPILLSKQNFDFELSIFPNANSKLRDLIKFQISLEPLFILIVLLIDLRKRIIRLLTNYFEGNKYKDLLTLYLN